MTLSLPPVVRCNRGFGAWFWVTMGLVALIAALAAVGSGRPPWAAALIGVGMVLVYTLTRAGLPRLTILPAEQGIRTRRDTVPFAAIAAIDLRGPRRPGIWARFVDDERRTLGRLSIAESLLAPATTEQWVALRQIVAAAAGRGRISPPDPRLWSNAGRPPGWSGDPMSADEALAVLDAQISWCEAGRRPHHRRAPMKALVSRVVILR